MNSIRQILALILAVGTAVASPLEREADKLLARTLTLISTKKLASEVGSKGKHVLLDTRQQKEFSVSHIPGAIWVGYKKFDLKTVREIPKDSSIVVYCSVGYRSEKIGEKLVAAGYKNVRNLYGGIFDWANNGHALEDHRGKPTSIVHGFDRKWARLLNPDVPKTLSE